MAGTVADYVVIWDSPINLGFSADIDRELPFTIPGTADVAAQHAILSLMVNSTGAAKALKASVSINGTNVWSYGPTDADLTRPFHEVLKASQNGIKTGSNILKVKVESGQGTFSVSDIVVWFQNTV